MNMDHVTIEKWLVLHWNLADLEFSLLFNVLHTPWVLSISSLAGFDNFWFSFLLSPTSDQIHNVARITYFKT